MTETNDTDKTDEAVEPRTAFLCSCGGMMFDVIPTSVVYTDGSVTTVIACRNCKRGYSYQDKGLPADRGRGAWVLVGDPSAEPRQHEPGFTP